MQVPIKGVHGKQLQSLKSCDPPSFCIKASLKNAIQVTITTFHSEDHWSDVETMQR
jgi:hypothetical protein